jgi:hypothetical protein
MRYKRGMDEKQLNNNPPPQRIRKVASKKVVDVAAARRDPIMEAHLDTRKERKELVNQIQATPQYQYLAEKHAAENGLPMPKPVVAGEKMEAKEKTTLNILPTIIPEYKLYYQVNGKEVLHVEGAVPAAQPTSLALHIMVPLLQRAGQLDLELSPIDLALTSLVEHHATHNYKLEVKFPYAVDDANPKVRLRKKNHTITVTLDVVGTLASLQPSALVEEEEEEGEPKERDWRMELPLRNKLMFRLS